MYAAPPVELTSLVDKLKRNMTLTGEEKAAIMALPWRTERLSRGHPIVSVGERPSRCFLINDGFVTSSKMTREGFEGITAMHIPGDMPDLFGLHLEWMDSDMRAASACQVAFVDHAPVKRLCEAFPRLNAALWRLTLVDASVLREWVVNVGYRPALARLAHLFCEIVLRMREVGRAPDDACEFPFTQLVLAQVTGMSTVHLNRSLQTLRAGRLIAFDGTRLVVLDWRGLVDLAGFEPDYLHQAAPRMARPDM